VRAPDLCGLLIGAVLLVSGLAAALLLGSPPGERGAGAPDYSDDVPGIPAPVLFRDLKYAARPLASPEAAAHEDRFDEAGVSAQASDLDALPRREGPAHLLQDHNDGVVDVLGTECALALTGAMQEGQNALTLSSLKTAQVLSGAFWQECRVTLVIPSGGMLSSQDLGPWRQPIGAPVPSAPGRQRQYAAGGDVHRLGAAKALTGRSERRFSAPDTVPTSITVASRYRRRTDPNLEKIGTEKLEHAATAGFTRALGSSGAIRGGSSPPLRTNADQAPAPDARGRIFDRPAKGRVSSETIRSRACAELKSACPGVPTQVGVPRNGPAIYAVVH